MKHHTCLLSALRVMLIFTAAAARAQSPSAADMEGLLDTGEITCSQAAYFVLAAAMENPPPNPEAAFNMAREKGWLPAKEEGGISLGGLSLLVMKAFDMKGGLLYRLFPCRRYAYRAMSGQGFIEGRAYPSRKVSGPQFLRILERVSAGGWEP